MKADIILTKKSYTADEVADILRQEYNTLGYEDPVITFDFTRFAREKAIRRNFSR